MLRGVPRPRDDASEACAAEGESLPRGSDSEDHEVVLNEFFTSLDQIRLDSVQAKSSDLPAMVAEAVVVRLAPQLQRVEQLLQVLQHHWQPEMPQNTFEKMSFVDQAAAPEARAGIGSAEFSEKPGEEQEVQIKTLAQSAEAGKQSKTSDSINHSASQTSQLNPDRCSCGNQYVNDAVFCRKCGRPRKGGKHSARDWQTIGSSTLQVDRTGGRVTREVWGGTVDSWFQCAPEPQRTGPLAQFVLSPAFERSFFLVIFINVSFSIYWANQLAASLAVDNIEFKRNVEAVFLGCYIVELLFKISVHKTYFVLGEDRWWNLFDAFIVGSSVVEVILSQVGAGGASLTFMRVYRVLRIGKILRVVKAARFLTDLRVMVGCLIGSAMPLVWCCVLLTLVILIFSMCFIQQVTEYMIDHPDICTSDPYYCEEVAYSFSSVQATMLALFQATTGGRDWGGIYDTVGKSGIFSRVQVIFFVVFFFFAFINVITSIFVDKAMTLAEPDHDEQIVRKKRDDQEAAAALKALIQQLDKDGQGTITKAEIQEIQHDHAVLDRLEHAGINIVDISRFFDTLCKTCGQTELDIDTFVEAAFQMKGVASALDVQTLLFQMQDIHRYLRRMEHKIEHMDEWRLKQARERPQV